MIELKQLFIVLLSVIPLLLYLDFVLGIQILRDFGHIKSIGFAVCLIIFAEVYRIAFLT